MYSTTLLAFVIYFAIIVLITWLAYRVTHNLSDYILGGRRLSGKVTALSAGASDMSNWLMMGLPGTILLFGLNHIWIPIGLAIGAYLNWLWVAKRLRLYTEIAGDAHTIPSYLHNRFHDRLNLLRFVTALVIVIFFTVYAAAGFSGGALLLQGLFDIDYFHALIISASFIFIYTAIGGFLAVSWIDFFQGCLMLFALLLVPLVALYQLNGLPDVIHVMEKLSPEKLNIWYDLSWISLISFLAWGLGYFGQPHILVRFMAIRSVKEIPTARRIGISWMVLSLLGAVGTGFLGIVYFADNPLPNAETVFLDFIKDLFHPFMIGILFAAVISAIMSTVSSQLIASSSSLVDDLHRMLFNRKETSNKTLMQISRFYVVIMALIAIWIASNPENTIFDIVSRAWAGLTAAFSPVILLSLLWPRMTRNGAVAGMITGTVTVLFWPLLKQYGGIWAFYEIVPGFIFACLAIVIVSLIDKPPSAAIQEEFAVVKSRLRAN